MAQRNTGVQYDRHVLEDRDPDEIVLRYTDEDGNIVDAGDSNPLPVTGTDASILMLHKLLCVNEDILKELKKLNKTGDELMDGEVL